MALQNKEKFIKPKHKYTMSLEEAEKILNRFGNVACKSEEYFEELSKHRPLAIKKFAEGWCVISVQY